ncbi:MAG: AGE family epimerase/isomerase [Akkermansia sp.]
MSTKLDFAALGDFYNKQLLEDIVPFWFPRAFDEKFGGLLHCFDADGTLVDSDKSVWAQGRMAWMLLTMYTSLEAKPEWLKWAESALNFLEDHCVDPADGRMYFHVAQDGTPIRKRRYAYSESFAAISFAAHAKATGNPESVKKARHWFDQFTKIHFTPGMIAPKFTGKRPTTDLGSRMITLVTAQEMRRFLGEDPLFTQWIDRCIDDLKTLFMKPDIKAVMESVAPDGSIIDHFDERTLNPGHAIEGGWFVLEEARHRHNDPELIAIGCQMIDWSFERGWDHEMGGLFYFRDVYGKPVQEYWNNMKFWWPHDEALIATMLAYGMTGEPCYAQRHLMVKEWAFTHFHDQKNGEWFGYLNRDGSPSNTLKGSLWKSFFHHPRAMWTCSHYCHIFGSKS